MDEQDQVVSPPFRGSGQVYDAGRTSANAAEAQAYRRDILLRAERAYNQNRLRITEEQKRELNSAFYSTFGRNMGEDNPLRGGSAGERTGLMDYLAAAAGGALEGITLGAAPYIVNAGGEVWDKIQGVDDGWTDRYGDVFQYDKDTAGARMVGDIAGGLLTGTGLLGKALRGVPGIRNMYGTLSQARKLGETTEAMRLSEAAAGAAAGAAPKATGLWGALTSKGGSLKNFMNESPILRATGTGAITGAAYGGYRPEQADIVTNEIPVFDSWSALSGAATGGALGAGFAGLAKHIGKGVAREGAAAAASSPETRVTNITRQIRDNSVVRRNTTFDGYADAMKNREAAGTKIFYVDPNDITRYPNKREASDIASEMLKNEAGSQEAVDLWRAAVSESGKHSPQINRLVNEASNAAAEVTQLTRKLSTLSDDFGPRGTGPAAIREIEDYRTALEMAKSRFGRAVQRLGMNADGTPGPLATSLETRASAIDDGIADELIRGVGIMGDISPAQQSSAKRVLANMGYNAKNDTARRYVLENLDEQSKKAIADAISGEAGVPSALAFRTQNKAVVGKMRNLGYESVPSRQALIDRIANSKGDDGFTQETMEAVKEFAENFGERFYGAAKAHSLIDDVYKQVSRLSGTHDDVVKALERLETKLEGVNKVDALYDMISVPGGKKKVSRWDAMVKSSFPSMKPKNAASAAGRAAGSADDAAGETAAGAGKKSASGADEAGEKATSERMDPKAKERRVRHYPGGEDPDPDKLYQVMRESGYADDLAAEFVTTHYPDWTPPAS